MPGAGPGDSSFMKGYHRPLCASAFRRASCHFPPPPTLACRHHRHVFRALPFRAWDSPGITTPMSCRVILLRHVLGVVHKGLSHAQIGSARATWRRLVGLRCGGAERSPQIWTLVPAPKKKRGEAQKCPRWHFTVCFEGAAEQLLSRSEGYHVALNARPRGSSSASALAPCPTVGTAVLATLKQRGL